MQKSKIKYVKRPLIPDNKPVSIRDASLVGVADFLREHYSVPFTKTVGVVDRGTLSVDISEKKTEQQLTDERAARARSAREKERKSRKENKLRRERYYNKKSA